MDVYGHPFVDVTFALPRGSSDLWSFAAKLSESGLEEGLTVITGATTVHDVLVGYSHDYRLLAEMYAAMEALGGQEHLAGIVAATANNLLLRDREGGLWDVATRRKLGPAEVDAVARRYDEIVRANSDVAFIEQMHAQWDRLYQQSGDMEGILGYRFAELVSEDGRLSLEALASLGDRLDAAAFVDHGRQCVLFVCWHNYTGHIANQSNQAVQSGGYQRRSDYGWLDPPIRFNSIACVANNPVNGVAYLGCGPSASIGLVGEKFKNHQVAFSGKSASNTSLLAFRQWLVAPTGINGRPRIAEYMGTCVLGTAYEGFTSIGSFVSGGQGFLNETNSGLTMLYTAGNGGPNGYNSHNAANYIHLQVGVKENPVVATYWPNAVTAHYSPITHYDIMWGAGITINVRTMDHGANWYGLSSHWAGQIGVYYLE